MHDVKQHFSQSCTSVAAMKPPAVALLYEEVQGECLEKAIQRHPEEESH
jgi:hypothetical protein